MHPIVLDAREIIADSVILLLEMILNILVSKTTVFETDKQSNTFDEKNLAQLFSKKKSSISSSKEKNDFN